MTIKHRRSLTSYLLVLSTMGCAAQPVSDCPKPEPPIEGKSEPQSAVSTKTAAPEKKLASTPNTVTMHPEYARSLARAAYIWGYPMVNMLNRRTAITQAPEPGHLNGVLPVAPMSHLGMLNDYINPGETFVTCPNQDVVYGLGFMDLEKQPVILQVPDFGDRFWVYAIYDIRTDQVGELGSPYGTKPGFYALIGPDFDGTIPEGVAGVIRSPSNLAGIIPRAFMNDTAEDRKAIQPVINQIAMYPFEEFTGKMQTIDWSKVPDIPGPPATGHETKWVKPETFFDELPKVLDATPPLPGEEALYEQFRMLSEIAEKDPAIKKVLVESAQQLDQTLMKDFILWKYNGIPAGNGWNRSRHNAEWGRDYYNRVGTSKSNMFDNRPSETQYFYTDLTSNGENLSGGSSYEITFAKGELPPVKGFWSLTMYNEAHFFHPNDLKRYSLGTKNKTLKYNDDGSLTLYAGNKSPGKDKESNWLPAPPGHFSLYIRAYWGENGITEGSWKPPVVVKK